jgi:hypothetical protein
MWRGIACGGLSLALLGGVGLPVSALAADNGCCKPSGKVAEHRKEFRAMHQKMLAEAKANDAALEKLIGELNSAPEGQKTDLEAAILTKLVSQHHEMLADWESMHAKMAQYRNERTPTSRHAMKGEKSPTTQK